MTRSKTFCNGSSVHYAVGMKITVVVSDIFQKWWVSPTISDEPDILAPPLRLLLDCIVVARHRAAAMVLVCRLVNEAVHTAMQAAVRVVSFPPTVYPLATYVLLVPT